LGFPVDYQSYLVKILPFWSIRMALEKFDLLENAAYAKIKLNLVLNPNHYK
jgi:hypothetical protein